MNFVAQADPGDRISIPREGADRPFSVTSVFGLVGLAFDAFALAALADTPSSSKGHREKQRPPGWERLSLSPPR